MHMLNPFSAAGNSCQQPGRLPLAVVNTANSLHSSILKSPLVNHVIMCPPTVEAWFQCVFVVSGVTFGRFSQMSVLDGEQWLDQRGKGLSLNQVSEQLQNDSDSGEEFDEELEENGNVKRMIKNDHIIVSETYIDVLAM